MIDKPVYAKVISGTFKNSFVQILGISQGTATCKIVTPDSDNPTDDAKPLESYSDANLPNIQVDLEELQRLNSGLVCPLTRAISLAAQKHAGQFDQGGFPYILHPIRIMMSMNTIDEKVVAILHDIIEDTDVTEEDLEIIGFNHQVIQALIAITHDKTAEPYFDYIRRVMKNPLAARIKAADLRDNLSVNRLTLDGRDEERHIRYIKALTILEKP